MYEAEPGLQIPKNEKIRIWRYMDLGKFLNLLENSRLHFSRLDQMADPFEGLPSTPVLEWPAMFRTLIDQGELPPDTSIMLDQSDQAHRRMIAFNRRTVYANCWHMNQHESEAMWKLYAGKGIAIQSTFNRLCDSLSKEQEHRVSIGEVAYYDFSKDWVVGAAGFGGAFAKRLSFEHEREIRAVIGHIHRRASGKI